MRYLRSTSLIVLALAGCVAPPQAPESPPAPVVTPAPRPTPAPLPLAVDWSDWPFTPGDWQYRSQPGATMASFGAGLLSVRCDRSSRQIILGGLANAPTTIRTTSMTKSITVTPDRAATGSIATFAANDPLLDALAFSRGRFVIEQNGQPPLVLPPHAEIGRVIEDCRG
ncbi:MAG: hypothetical protein ABIR08_06855 [Sphingomonas sp.]